jgi:phytoene synthase
MSIESPPGELTPASLATAILAAKGKTFHWASALLGKRFRQRATRLYGFCRTVDDLADETGSLRHARRALMDCGSAIRFGLSSHPTHGDMVELMRECRIERSVVLELIDGIAGDLEPVRMESVADLLHYCSQVAGTVGVMMCGVFDVTEAAAQAHAIDLGIAMQLTNLCRDVAVDAAAGRRYLPATLIGDLNPVELIAPVESLRPILREGIEALLRLADAYYSSGEWGLAYLPLESRLAILVASQVYRAIGSKLLHRDCAYWRERIAIAPADKFVLSARLLMSRPLTRGFWVPPHRHDACLHRAFAGSPLLATTLVSDHGR